MFGLTRTVAIVLAGLLITAGSAGISSKALPSSAPEEVGLSSERLARMNKAIHEYVDAGRTPGVVTLIARQARWCTSTLMARPTSPPAGRRAATTSSACTR
jgi:hypothetical protein